ncbi:MAG: hypothetical protein LBK41_07160 [Clostridiales bacterium]|jgi:hypothetical protein|nr:hypothetical protein [Clostridiales bacterium]
MRKVLGFVKLGFKDYVKVFVMSGFPAGVFFGLMQLTLGSLGESTQGLIGNSTFDGIIGGLINVVMFPVGFTLVSAAAALLMYPFYFLAVKIIEHLD